jgi:PAS domain S-box-containing protein
MNWGVVGIVYAAACVALTIGLADQGSARLVAGNIALLLPPLAPLYVLVKRRRDWRGRQAVFWAAIAAWSVLWFVGQIGWSADELVRATPTPWFKWHIVLQLCGSALPLIALLARPHRPAAEETALPVAIDVTALVFLTGFLYWSLIIAPSTNPAQAATGLRALAIVGPLVRLASVAGLLFAAASAGDNPWAGVYRRMAVGMAHAFGILVGLSVMTVRGNYGTGSPADIGWMLPFFFAAWAAEASPSSPAPLRFSPTRPFVLPSPIVLFVALLIVPVVGHGLRYLMPLGEPVDSLREMATFSVLVGGMVLLLVRLRVDHRVGEHANRRLRLLATACEQAAELIVIVRGTRILYANDAFCRGVGYSWEELEAVQPGDLVAEESRPELAGFRERIRSEETVQASTVMRRRDGTTFQATWSATPIMGPDGTIDCVVGVVRDLTEEIRLRDQLVRGERLSALGEFVSGMAHEINNPLQSIIGSLELALDQQDLDPAVRGDIERARSEASRAGRTVRNLLRFVRQAPNERVLLDLNEIVKATMSVRSYELEMAGIQIREEYAPMLPLVLANREEIQQVLLNLVMNAQQAMSNPDGTRVLSVRTLMAGLDAVVEVRDTGPGIPEELAGRIFEPFFTTKSAGAGPGLGLSLSLGIANAHQGQLELVAAASGTCFRLTLPGCGFPGPASVH